MALITGTDGVDIIDGLGSGDEIFALLGNDVVFGNNGDDTISGGGGNDLLFGNKKDDTIHGDEGDDRLAGGDGDDALFGDDGNDKLVGNSGTNTYEGGLGKDLHILSRAGDPDTVAFNSVDESLRGNGTFDIVRNFSSADGDKIDISAIVAAGATFDITHGIDASFVRIDGNNDGVFTTNGVDGLIRVNGVTDLAASDLITS